MHVGDRVRIKNTTTDKAAKIVDRDIGVFNEENQNIALSKADFVSYICDDTPPFNTFNFESFRKIFDVIEEILRTIPKAENLHSSSRQQDRPELHENISERPSVVTKINSKDRQRQDQMIELVKLSQKHGVDIDSMLRLLQAEKGKTLFTRHSNIQQIIKQEIQKFRGES